MFQNIQRETDQNYQESEKNKTSQKKNKIILKNLFSVQNMVLYLIAFLISMVGFSSENLILSISPFAVAFLAASLSGGMPIGIVYVLTLIGTFVKFGPNALLTYFLTTFVFFIAIVLKRPKEQEVNEKKKVGIHLLFSVFLVQVIPLFFRSFYVYDLLTSIMLTICSYVFYKIFSNSILMIKEWGNKTVFSIEEVMGTSLLLGIATCALGPIQIFGFSIRNILSILIVLILGWKNGILVGATGGITIGVVLGIIGNSEPIMVASYAISGMIAGIFQKLGKIGVVIGFILGNILLTYVANGNTVPVISFQEILIAFIGLLAVPKHIQIPIGEFYNQNKLLPEATGRVLEENQDTILKLNSMSEAIADIARSYQEAASTVLEEAELKEQEASNESIFIEELKINLKELEDNIFYDDIDNNENEIVDTIFTYLVKEEILTQKDFMTILEKNNLYMMQTPELKEDMIEMVKAINSAYRISKLNFIWKRKMQENKKNVSSQLEGVSEAISHLADTIEEPEENFENQKTEFKKICEQKEIAIKQIEITKFPSGRYQIEVTVPICEDEEGKECNIKKIHRILKKIWETSFTIEKQDCGIRENKKECKFTYLSEDNYQVQIGLANCLKASSSVSGDSHIQTKLADGKYLIALSDGMGSGPEARKSSKIAIKMLERLLKAGFDKQVSLKLINSTLIANTKEDMYATLDIQILDLFAGNMEFIKNGACPTYIKRKKEVQLLKSITLPTGIMEQVDLVVYDYDLEDGDILVMCSDGIIDANTEYINKELWVKYLLEDIQVEDTQKIADLILNEAIDAGYGKAKDDMTVIVAKVVKKQQK